MTSPLEDITRNSKREEERGKGIARTVISSILTIAVGVSSAVGLSSCVEKKQQEPQSASEPARELEQYFKSSKTLYVSCLVNLRNRIVELYPFYIFDESIEYKQGNGKLSVEYLDSNNTILHKINFPEAGEDEMNPVSYDLPFYPETTKIRFKYGDRILRLRYNNRILKAFEITKNSPEVKVESPKEGENIRGIYNIIWKAMDKDKDKLLYMIAYSDNGGKSWEPLIHVLGTSFPITRYSFDTRQFPNGTDYMIKVIATDGFNSGEDISGKFSINN